MKTKICMFLVCNIAFNLYCQNADNKKNIETIKKVILDEGMARQNNNFELFSECWSHEKYILNYWAINWGCATISGWEELSESFKKNQQGEPDPALRIRRENINIHINGNIAVSDFDLYIDNFNGENLVSKANATLEKTNDSWKLIYLNVFFEESFQKKEAN